MSYMQMFLFVMSDSKNTERARIAFAHGIIALIIYR